MNYLIFDNEIYYETPDNKGIVTKEEINTVFKGPENDYFVAVIDSLQKRVAAPEKPDSKRDEVIAASFTNEYVTQSERIAPNLFQVIGIEKSKVGQVYKHLGFENVRLVVPYGVALREFLRNNNIVETKKIIVFLDHMGNQVLLTIYKNNIFTVPRRLSTALNRVASELTRSREHFRALNKDKEEVEFLIATNSEEIQEELVSGGIEAKEKIIFIADAYPALSGLKQGKFSMHYLLPEAFIRLRKMRIAKRQFKKLMLLAGVFLAILCFSLVVYTKNKDAGDYLKRLFLLREHKVEELKQAYALKYQDIIRQEKKTDFSYLLTSFIEALPFEYKAESITVKSLALGRYRFEAIVYLEGMDRSDAELKLPPLFKKARIENIMVRGKLGQRIVMDIL